MNQAALLVRVSTLIQDFSRQIDDLQKLSKKMGYSVKPDDIYAEKISGFSKVDKRLELIRLVNDIKEGKKIDMVFVTEVSRISRTPKIGYMFIEELAELGIPVYIQNMNQASLNEDGSRNSTFFIMMNILLEFSSNESKDTKLRQKSGKLFNFKEGRFHGGEHVPFGYMKGERDSERKAAKLIINPEEADVVKTVFDMYINKGAGMKVIANYLNAQKVPSKTGVDWSITTINQMLKNEIYYGSRVYVGVLYENVVPAIITKDVFDKALAVSASRDVTPDRNIRYLYLLNNKVKCGWCSHYFIPKFSTGLRKKVKNKHYHCGHRFRRNECQACGIGLDKIESLVWTLVARNNGVLQFLKSNNKTALQAQTEISKLEQLINSLQFDLSKKNEQVKNCKQLFKLGRSSEKELVEDLTKIDAAVKVINDKIKAMQEQIRVKTEWLKVNNSIKQYTKFLNDIGTDRYKINEILDVVLDKVNLTSVTKGSLCQLFIVTVHFKGGVEPVSVLFNKNAIGRPIEYRMEYYHTPAASASVKYVDDILQNDTTKLVKEFKKMKVMHNGKEVNNTGLMVRLVPFINHNIHEEADKPKTKARVPKAKLVNS